jgi:hypothetical protein
MHAGVSTLPRTMTTVVAGYAEITAAERERYGDSAHYGPFLATMKARLEALIADTRLFSKPLSQTVASTHGGGSIVDSGPSDRPG